MKTKLSQADRRKYLNRALLAADWFASSQLGETYPQWNANEGRFLYYYYMPEKKYVPGINWTQGRGLFVLTEAFKIRKKKVWLQAAIKGAQYLEALQITDPRYPLLYGAFREENPQCSWGGTLDCAQAATGLFMLGKVTRQRAYIEMCRQFCDFILRTHSQTKGFPGRIVLAEGGQAGYMKKKGFSCISNGIAIPLWHYYRHTREKKYLRPVIWAADKILSYQRNDGAFFATDVKKGRIKLKANHHFGHGKGRDRLVLRNDDAMMTVVLAAYMATGKKKYLDAAVAYADWIINNGPLERPFSAFPVQANNVLDIGRVARKDYTEWVMDHLNKHLLRLQVFNSKDPRAYGGFRGEDEQGDGGVFGGTSLDYVPTRVTCYAAGTLFRLSGKGTGSGFSVYGLG
jgi:uncharacterized protein YyaL (SSP411 family)